MEDSSIAQPLLGLGVAVMSIQHWGWEKTLPEPAGVRNVAGLLVTRKSLLDYLSLILILGVLLGPTCNGCERFTHEQGKDDMERLSLQVQGGCTHGAELRGYGSCTELVGDGGGGKELHR